MPLKCYIRPNRRARRGWTARAAARAVCAAVNDGVTPSEIRAEMADCVPCEDARRRQQQVAQAIAAMQASNTVMAIAEVVLQGLGPALRSIQLISRFVPQARLAGVALQPVVQRINVALTEVRVARAANDAAIRVLRLAA